MLLTQLKVLMVLFVAATLCSAGLLSYRTEASEQINAPRTTGRADKNKQPAAAKKDEKPQDAWQTFCKALRNKDEKALLACSIAVDGKLAELRNATLRYAVAEQKMQEIAVAKFGRGAMALVPDSRQLSFLDKWSKGEGRVEAKVSGKRAVLTVSADTEFTVACRREGEQWKIDYAQCEDFQQADAKEIKRIAKIFGKEADALNGITQSIKTNRVQTLPELENILAIRLPPVVSPDRAK
ncbi:MAG TPA: hypothetical protein VMG10_23105 [Gemmataceae bacterium]|nr:hypothetical protein [Gemmataceae bacterium]